MGLHRFRVKHGSEQVRLAGSLHNSTSALNRMTSKPSWKDINEGALSLININAKTWS